MGEFTPYQIRKMQQQWQASASAKVWADNRELNKLRDRIWKDALIAAGVSGEAKCVHGHMYYEHYCEVCRLAPVDPDYNPDVYRDEIIKALSKPRRVLTNNRPAVELRASKTGGSPEAETEGQKNLKELRCIIDIEIWKATKKYGDQMNARLAYTIADNQAGKFLGELIEEQTVAVVDPITHEPELDEFEKPKRIQRFHSLDLKTTDANGEVAETSIAEQRGRELASEQGGDWLQAFIDKGGTPALQKLVNGWRGDQRKVGEAMLQPDFTVRGIPGMSRSQVSRVRAVVLKAFRSLIT
jgi:hypothetical protein